MNIPGFSIHFHEHAGAFSIRLPTHRHSICLSNYISLYVNIIRV